jgi:hypothetical protein
MRCGTLLSIVVLLAPAALAGADPTHFPFKLAVKAGGDERVDARAYFKLPESLANEKQIRLVEVGGKQVPAQLDDSGRLWWIVRGKFAAGDSRSYQVEAGSGQTEAITLVDSGKSLEVRAADRALLRYNKAHVEPPEGVDERYGRSAHLHPVFSPGGAIVTDELPPDHYHQSGIFLAYTRSRFEGRNVDFWNLAGGKGRVRFKSLKAATSGPLYGEFVTEHEHVDLTAESDQSQIGRTSGGKVALVEQWTVRIWPDGLASGYWIMDIVSSQRCATDSPLVLPEYHYGGMAIRAAREWTPGNVTFLTSEGDERIKGNHTRPKWCDIRGQVAGESAGIALMTHPANFRFPDPLRIHPTMPYMVYTPQVLGTFEIKPGQTHQVQYRFVVHDGELTTERLNQLWQDFAEPLVAVAASN